MAFRSNARAAVRTDEQRSLRQCPFCHHDVRNDADVGAKANEFNAFQCRKPFQILNKSRRTEAWLVKDWCVQNLQRCVDLPAIRFPDAVGDWQIPALLRR